MFQIDTPLIHGLGDLKEGPCDQANNFSADTMIKQHEGQLELF